MREKDIMHECGKFWVYRGSNAYTVMQSGITHSTSVQSFAKTDDGLSIAIAYANYKGGK